MIKSVHIRDRVRQVFPEAQIHSEHSVVDHAVVFTLFVRIAGVDFSGTFAVGHHLEATQLPDTLETLIAKRLCQAVMEDIFK